MDERDWLILSLLYENKNITYIAKKLTLTQPTISSRIRQIEKRFEILVFIRTKKGVKLTAEGEFLAQQANKFLKKIQFIDDTISNMRDVPSGVLRIGASTFSAKYILPSLLSNFKLQNPSVEFKVISGYSRDIVQQLYDGNIHVAFIRGDYDWPDKFLLINENIYISSLKPLLLNELPQLPQVDYPNDYSVKLALNKWWDENYRIPPKIEIEVDNVDTAKEMVLKNLGYSFIPEILATKDSQLSLIQMKYKSGKSVTRNTWFFYNKDMIELKMVKNFYDFVLKTKFKIKSI